MATLGLDTSAYERNVDKAKEKMDSASKSMQKSTKEAGNGAESMAKQFASATAKAQVLANAVVSVAEKAFSAASSMVSTGIKYNMQMEKYQTAFTNMLGSAEKAANALEQIKKDAARTPLDVSSLVQANQLLISAGVDASSARTTILALGDAVAAAGGGNAELSRMAQNLQQIKNVGKAASIDIKQFAYAGIDIYGILADYTGKSTAEVQGMTVTYDLLTAALQRASEEGGRYYNAMETQSQTLSGRLETLKDNWAQLIGSLTEGFADTEGKLVSAAAGWVETLQSSFEEYGAKGLMEAGGSIVNDIANGIADRIPQLAEQAGAAVQRFSDYLVENMGTIVETGGNLLASLADGILNAFPDIANAAVQTVGTLASELLANADKIFEQGTKIVGKLCEGLLSVLGDVTEAAGNLVETIVTKIFSTDWVSVGKNIASSIGQGIQNGVSSMSGPLDRLSYKLNHALGKNGYAEYNSFEAWAAANGKTGETKYQRGSQKDESYWKRYGNKLAEQYGLNEKTEPEVTNSGGTGGGKSKKSTAKAAADTKKLADTVTETSKQILAGTGNIVGNIQRVVETADNTYNVYDGTTKKLKGTTKETVETITDSWKEVVDGTEKTIKSVTKKVTDAAGKVTTTTQKTCDDVVLSVTELQSRIDQNLSNAQKQWSNGIFGRLQNAFTDLKNRNWAGLATDVANLIWGEVSQDQRELISKWAADALGVINDTYSGGGVKAAFATIKSLFTDGIAASATEAGTAVQSFGSILSSLSASGGAGAQLANVASGVSSMATSIMGSLGNIVSLVASNPVLAAILGVAAVAGGIGLAAWLGSKNGEKESTDSKSTTLSYKDIQDAYWYGSQRSFAGYDFRTDGYAFGESPANGRLSSYQQKMQQSVDALYNVVQQYLPQTANTVIKLDDGTLVGALAPSIDAQLGHLATLAERGN